MLEAIAAEILDQLGATLALALLATLEERITDGPPDRPAWVRLEREPADG